MTFGQKIEAAVLKNRRLNIDKFVAKVGMKKDSFYAILRKENPPRRVRHNTGRMLAMLGLDRNADPIVQPAGGDQLNLDPAAVSTEPVPAYRPALSFFGNKVPGDHGGKKFAIINLETGKITDRF